MSRRLMRVPAALLLILYASTLSFAVQENNQKLSRNEEQGVRELARRVAADIWDLF
jgi:hypothetical protein